NVYFTKYSFVQDHYQYLASIGWIALLAAGAALTARRVFASSRTAVVAAALLLAALGALTWRRIPVYLDLMSLWSDTVARNPDAWIAKTNLGVELSRQVRTEEAIERFRASIRLEPRQNEARLDLGEILIGQGKLDEAIALLRDAVAARPEDANASYNL